MASSPKASKIPRFMTQNSNNIEDENEEPILHVDTNRNNDSKTRDQKKQEEQQSFVNLKDFINGTELPTQPTIESHLAPIKTQETQEFISLEQEPRARTGLLTQEKIHSRSQQLASSSSSSSETDSVIQHVVHTSKQRHTSSPPKHPTPPRIPIQTIREDSQGTLIDDNLDELSPHLKQDLTYQERQTLNIDTKIERTMNKTDFISVLLSKPDITSNDLVDHDKENREDENVIRSSPNKNDFQHHRHSSHHPECSKSHRKIGRHHNQRHSASRHTEKMYRNDSRTTDVTTDASKKII